MKMRYGMGLALFCVLVLGVSLRGDDQGDTVLTATLVGGNEVPPINSAATGQFRATIHADGTINFTETYANLSTLPIVSHIHFGQVNVSGGVMVFLCGGGNQPNCPSATSGTFSGTITAANVTGPTAQGVAAGDLASALRIIVQQRESYVNLHSTMFPGGEIRGTTKVNGGDN